MRFKSTILSVLFITNLTGCAHLSNKEKTLIAMAAGVVVGGTVGYLTTPKDGSNPVAHATLFAGVTSAAAGGAGLFIFDESKKTEEALRQAEILKKELDAARETSSSTASQLDSEMPSFAGSKELPKELQSLVKPGKWQLYRLNHWRAQSDSVLIHEDRMLKLTPPQLNLGVKPE